MHGKVLASFVWSSTKNHWIKRTVLNLIMRIWTFYFSSSNHACFDHLFRETTQSTALEQECFDIRSLSRALRNLWLIETLRSNDADGNENVKKKKTTTGLISKTTTLHVHHTFLYISFPVLHDYDVKMLNFAFYGERKQVTTKFYFCFWASIWSLEIQL